MDQLKRLHANNLTLSLVSQYEALLEKIFLLLSSCDVWQDLISLDHMDLSIQWVWLLASSQRAHERTRECWSIP